MASSIINIFKIPELRKRILFTLALLAVYRIGIFITVPGVDRYQMQLLINRSAGSFLGLFNLFSGGALEKLSVFALGIMPYISASIILQLLTVVVPTVERLSKEGEAGRKKINQYTRYGTVLLSAIQAFIISSWLIGQKNIVVIDSKFAFRFLTVVTLTTGTIFIMWLGEQITERGIGNGISLIIFAGIVDRLPIAIFQTFQKFKKGGEEGNLIIMLIVLAVVVVVIGVIVFFERGQRRIPVQYAKRVVGKKVTGGQSTHLPLKINTAGVIPPIFASSILMFPGTLAGIFPGNVVIRYINDAFNPSGLTYNIAYVLLIIFFCYFYTAVTFNPVDVADNMKKYGGYIPGIRPGKKTAEYIDNILTRITFGGALYVSAICVLPIIMQKELQVTFWYGGTSLLIVVGVALDTAEKIESHLITRHYDGFTGPKGPRIRGRRR